MNIHSRLGPVFIFLPFLFLSEAQISFFLLVRTHVHIDEREIIFAIRSPSALPRRGFQATFARENRFWGIPHCQRATSYAVEQSITETHGIIDSRMPQG